MVLSSPEQYPNQSPLTEFTPQLQPRHSNSDDPSSPASERPASGPHDPSASHSPAHGPSSPGHSGPGDAPGSSGTPRKGPTPEGEDAGVLKVEGKGEGGRGGDASDNGEDAPEDDKSKPDLAGSDSDSVTEAEGTPRVVEGAGGPGPDADAKAPSTPPSKPGAQGPPPPGASGGMPEGPAARAAQRLGTKQGDWARYSIALAAAEGERMRKSDQADDRRKRLMLFHWLAVQSNLQVPMGAP